MFGHSRPILLFCLSLVGCGSSGAGVGPWESPDVGGNRNQSTATAALTTGGTSAGSTTGGTTVMLTGGFPSSTTAPAGGTSTGAAAAGGALSTGGVRTGGASAAGGMTGVGGVKATGMSGARTGGAPTTGGTSSSSLSCNTGLPAYTSSTTVSSTMTISGTKDYGMQRFCANPNTLGPGDQSESQKPIFMLSKGAVLKNVTIGGAGCSAADGVHCESGSCTLENVWIGDVGEDAISFKGSDSSQVMAITGGGAFDASDKVVQHNGPGTIKITNFIVKNAGKLYRSCGNCSTQYVRHVEMTNIFASGVGVLAGINANYGDTAKITNLTKCGTVSTTCETFTGNSSGDEPTALNKYTSSGDGKYCLF